MLALALTFVFVPVMSHSASDIDYIAHLVEKGRDTGGDRQLYALKASRAIEFCVGLYERDGNNGLLQQLEALHSKLGNMSVLCPVNSTFDESQFSPFMYSGQSVTLSGGVVDQHIVRADPHRPPACKGPLNADILHEILSFLSCRSQAGRAALYNSSLASRTFHEVATRHLWRHPRLLTTDDRLKKFIFGAIVSVKSTESGRIKHLGQHVRSIHLQEGKDSPQSRFLISEIGRLVPNVTSLSLTMATPDPQAVQDMLLAFPRINRLELSVASNRRRDIPHSRTFDSDEIELVPPVKQILGNLTSLCLIQFDTYWGVVKTHLSSNLMDLVISSSDIFNDEDGDGYDQLTELKSLVSLEIDCPTLAPDFMTVALGSLPKLERLTLRGESREREEWMADGAYDLVEQALHGHSLIKEFWLSWAIPLQVFTDLVVNSPTNLEEVRVCIADREDSEEEVEEAIISLVQQHQQSLRVLVISRESGNKITVHEGLLEALAAAPLLERILLPVKKDSIKDLKLVSLVNQLLGSCSRLQWTDTLHNLIHSSHSLKMEDVLEQRQGRVYSEEYYLGLESRRNEHRQDPSEGRFGRISPLIDFWRYRDVGSLWI